MLCRFEKLIRPYEFLDGEYRFLKEELQKLDNPVVYAHNDLLLGNVLYNPKENTVTFIDFEYTGYNYQAFDIANHFAEFVGNISFLADTVADIFYSSRNINRLFFDFVIELNEKYFFGLSQIMRDVNKVVKIE